MCKFIEIKNSFGETIPVWSLAVSTQVLVPHELWQEWLDTAL